MTIVWDTHLLPFVLLAVAAALIVGEAVEGHDRRRRDRMRRRLGPLASDTRLDQPLGAMTRRRPNWRGASVRFGLLASRTLPQRMVTLYGALLLRAGRGEPAMLPVLITTKLLAAVGGAVVAIVLAGVLITLTPALVVVVGLLGFLVAYLLPDLWLQRQIAAYTRDLREAIPPGIDLLSLALEAGLGFDAAVGHLVAGSTDAFAREMRAYQLLRRLGRSREAALEQVAARTDVPEMITFTSAVAQGQELGIGIVRTLRDLATDLRIRHRQRVAAQVQTASVRMLFPIITCIMPALFIVLLGPALATILKALG